MRKIQSLVVYTVSAFLLASAGCSRVDLPEQPAGEGGLRIRVSLSGITTRTDQSTMPGVGEENRVKSLAILVYEDGWADEPVGSASASYTGSDQLAGEYDLTLSGPIEDVFTDDESKVKNAVVLAVANYPGTLPVDESLSEIRALVLDAQSSFLSGSGTDADPYLVSDTPSFVMTAEGGFEEEEGTGNAKADLELKRVASKITLTINFPEDTNGNPVPIVTHGTDHFFGPVVPPATEPENPTTTTWTAMTDGKNTRAYLVNGQRKGLLGAVSVPESFAETTPFTYGETILSQTGNQQFTFYTYPMDLTDAGGTYLKLILPWRYVTTLDDNDNDATNDVIIDQNVVELYYKVMLPPSLASLDANTWYDLPLAITVLGGEASRPTVEVVPDIAIKDWVNLTAGRDVGYSAYTEAHFLFLNPDATNIEAAPSGSGFDYIVTVTKGETFSFPYYATDPVEMDIDKIWYTHLHNGTETSLTLDDGRTDIVIVEDNAAGADFATLTAFNAKIDRSRWLPDEPWTKWVTLNNEKNAVSLNHTLSKDVTDDDFSVSVYHYDLTLKLTGPDRTEEIKVRIQQVPKILVSSQFSQRNIIINGQSNSYSNSSTSARNNFSNQYNFKVITTNSGVKPFNGTHWTGADPSDYNTSVSISTDSNVGMLRKKTASFPSTYAQKSRYRYMFEVVPFDDQYVIADPLVTIEKGDNGLGMILTESSTSTGNLPITTNTYRGNSSTNTIIRTNGNSNTTSGVSAINYRAPLLTVRNVSNTVSDDPSKVYARKIIAPKFIIASSYGMSRSYLSFGQAFLRCATYQEDGYPAGRWRLPTEGEIEYINLLNSYDVVENLLAGQYWASSGRMFTGTGFRTNVQAVSGNASASSAAARCVYDAWYWGEDEVSGVNGTYTVSVSR